MDPARPCPIPAPESQQEQQVRARSAHPTRGIIKEPPLEPRAPSRDGRQPRYPRRGCSRSPRLREPHAPSRGAAAVPVPAHGAQPGAAGTPRGCCRRRRGALGGSDRARRREGRGERGEAPPEPPRTGKGSPRPSPERKRSRGGSAGTGKGAPAGSPKAGRAGERSRRGISTAGGEHEPCPRRGGAHTPSAPSSPVSPVCPPPPLPAGHARPSPARPPPPFGIAAMAARPPRPESRRNRNRNRPQRRPPRWAARAPPLRCPRRPPGAPAGTAQRGRFLPAALGSLGAAARAVGSALLRQRAGQPRGRGHGRGGCERTPGDGGGGATGAAVSGTGTGVGDRDQRQEPGSWTGIEVRTGIRTRTCGLPSARQPRVPLWGCRAGQPTRGPRAASASPGSDRSCQLGEGAAAALC